MDCQFCDVISGRADGTPLAFESPGFAAAMAPRQPTGPGYTLVVPRAHVRDLHELADRECGPMLATVRRISHAVQRAFDVPSTTIMQNNGAPAQSVMHLHFHIVPRTPDDGWPSKTDAVTGRDQLQAQADRLHAALNDLRVEEVRSVVAALGPEALLVDELRPADLVNLWWSGGRLHVKSVASALERGEDEVCYLAVRAPDGLPVAKGGIDFARHADAGAIWQLATHERLQSHGLGSRLMLEAERRIAARGRAWAELGVENNNPRARALYERLGYVAYGAENEAWDQEDETGNVYRYEAVVTLMRKRL